MSDPKIGIGGAPTRATTLPTDAAARKTYPVASGVLDYFPDAIAAISHISWRGNEQHNPGQPLHWARGKSTDEADTMLRHFLQRGTLDTDGVRHSAKMAWRALALLQKEIEADQRSQQAQTTQTQDAKIIADQTKVAFVKGLLERGMAEAIRAHEEKEEKEFLRSVDPGDETRPSAQGDGDPGPNADGFDKNSNWIGFVPERKMGL